MIGRQRDLGGADQVQVVGREPVNLVGVLAEKPGALHDSGFTNTGGIIGMKPLAMALLHRELQHRPLQLCATPRRK